MIKYHTALAADVMAKASPDRWDEFIGLLGGDAASNLLDAIERNRPTIEHHNRSKGTAMTAKT